MNNKALIKTLKDDGWSLVHVRGNHQQFKHAEKPGRVTVPDMPLDFPVGVVRSIYKQAGWI